MTTTLAGALQREALGSHPAAATARPGVVAALALLLSACYGATPLQVPDSGEDAGAVDADADGDGDRDADGDGGDADEDAPSPPPWVWEVEVDFGVQDIVATADGFVVAGQSSPNVDTRVAWLDREGREQRGVVISHQRSTHVGQSYDIVAVAVSPTGEVYVLSEFVGTVDLDPGPGEDLRTAWADWEHLTIPPSWFLVSLSPSGLYRWGHVFSTGPSPDVLPRGIAAASDGSVLVVGQIQAGADVDPGPGVETPEVTGSCDALVTRLSAEGELLWARTFGLGSDCNFDRWHDLAIGVIESTEGTLLVTGSLEMPNDLDPGAGTDLWGADEGTTARPFVSELTMEGDYLRGWALLDSVEDTRICANPCGGTRLAQATDGSVVMVGTSDETRGGADLLAAGVPWDGRASWSWEVITVYSHREADLAAAADGSLVLSAVVTLGFPGPPGFVDPAPEEDRREVVEQSVYLLRFLPDGRTLGMSMWPTWDWYASTPVAITDDGLAVVAWSLPDAEVGPTHLAAIRLEDIGR